MESSKSELPRPWVGQAAFVIGCGPSANIHDLEELRGLNVVLTNYAYRICPHAEFLHFTDAGYPLFNEEIKNNYKGKTITYNYTDYPNPTYKLKNKSYFGLSLEQDSLGHGNNSGSGAFNCAVLLGAKRISLIGFDMRVVAG